jgi:hypothetical protein
MDKKQKKIKLVKSNRGILTCPFCGSKIDASVMSGSSCEHLYSKDSTGMGEFRKSIIIEEKKSS